MISLVEALNYRCLRYIRQRTGRFHVLVGPNASGKTTFLDVIGFLSDLVTEGLDKAIGNRTQNPIDLLWGRAGSSFTLAVEAKIPEQYRDLLAVPKYDTVRYEVEIGIDYSSNEVAILAEKGWLKTGSTNGEVERWLFPEPQDAPPSILMTGRNSNTRSLFSKTPGGNDNYYADAQKKEGRWAPAFKLGPRKSTLGNLPEDEANFPVSTWFKQFISTGVERIVLNSLHIRRASPPGQGTGFKPDGSNLPWVIAELEEHNEVQLNRWISHLQTALTDLEGIRTVVRDDDRHRYIVLVYRDGLEVPSWMASDGTLRLMALTLPAYLEGLNGAYLIEEPENGIHPKAVETMFDSLSNVYSAQVLMASHSPVVLSIAELQSVLCFAKSEGGATDIVRGDQHPQLKDWHGEVDLGTLFASGILG